MIELGSMNHDNIDCCCMFQCSLPQYETQRVLETHLKSLGGAVERGVTATKVELKGDEVSVELTHANGNVETVRPTFLIGAGGAHSVTRHSMNEPLAGTTYRGNFLVADIAMPAPFPRNEAGVICGPNGFILLAPLPGGRWISFQDLEEGVETATVEDVVARVIARLGEKFRPTNVRWFAPFRMHRRIVSRLAHDRRFLIGDAAHLSSPFGGEGLNAGLHDGFNLAWKLALVLRGRATSAILDGYAAERQIADAHVLDVSDHVHTSIVDVADAARARREVHPAGVDPIMAALVRNSRAMIDVDYLGSPLIVDYAAETTNADLPHPGQWYPDWGKFGGTKHRVLVFGDIPNKTETLAQLERRWSTLAEIAHNPEVDSARAGVPTGGVVMIRPDGHIGFRHPSVSAEAFAALDRHLSSYLIPEN
jgi:2-polyprenyl-6-methoxyphenol hydroxylase-like FAD-dependent oxidoreductase